MLITEQDLVKVIYQETLNEIKRDNIDLIPDAIKAAQDTARAHLSRYDLSVLFDPNKTDDEYLKNILISIAAYNIIRLSNVNVNYEQLYQDSRDAIKELEKIQKGYSDPGWALKPADPVSGKKPGSLITHSSNGKRTNYY